MRSRISSRQQNRQQISFVESQRFVAGSIMLELCYSVDKDGQMQLPFKFSRGD